MDANEKIMNVVCEGNQSENKFFPEYAPIDMGMGTKSAAIELEQLVRACGSTSVLY